MPTVAPESSIGPYVAREELGRGGMGTVVAAWDPRLRREVAIKILHRSADDPGLRARVIREAQALARLSHPHVVPVYDVGMQGGALWVAMERVRGPTLAEWLQQPRPWRDVVDAFVQAARGLSAAHAAGIVHRDFKPSNAMIGPDPRGTHAIGRVMVLDFGLAWAPGVDGARSGSTTQRSESSQSSAWGRDPLAFTLTAPGSVVGTPPYMAPEQHERSEVDARADQYGLCVALWEALAGARPFVGDLLQMVAAKVKGPPAPPISTDVPARVWSIVVRGLAPDPSARWPDIDALADALERASRRRSRAGIAIGLGAVVMLGAGLAARPEIETDDRCTTLAARAEAHRRGDGADEIADAFAATGREHAEATAKAVRARIEASATGWAGSVAAACEGSPPNDRALDCVEGALDAADALVRVLVTGGQEAIVGASRIAEGLPSPTTCEVLAANALPPLHPAVRRELALARTLGRSARQREAIEATMLAFELAQAEGDERGATHALALRGGLRMDAGEWDGAEEDLRNALWSSIALGDDELAATAATKLVHLCAHRLDAECTRPWIRHAEASLERLGDAGADVRDGLELALGDVALQRGELDEALVHYETALEHAQANAERDLEVAALQDAIGVVHAVAGRHEQAIEMYERAAASFRAIAGPLQPDRASTHERMAASYHALGRAAEARAQIDEAIAILEAAHGPDHPHTVRLRGNLVLVMLDEGRNEEALELALSVLEAKRRIFGEEDVQVAMALANVGLARAALGQHEQALPTFRESLTLWERRVGPDNPMLWHALAGIARSALAVGDVAQAHEASSRALALVEAQGTPPDPDLVLLHAEATKAMAGRVEPSTKGQE